MSELAAPALRPKVGRDDVVMRLFMGAIGLYLVVALALPLWAMLSKSVRDGDGAFVGLANYAEYFSTPALAMTAFRTPSGAGFDAVALDIEALVLPSVPVRTQRMLDLLGHSTRFSR